MLSEMTQSKAKVILESEYKFHGECSVFGEALTIAIKALEENEQYKVLGTVEELRIAKEKQIPKKPIQDQFSRQYCPNCGWIVYQNEYGGRYLPHCKNCGQAIDWRNEGD